MDMVSTKISNIVIYYVFKGLWRLLLTSFPDNTSNKGFIKASYFGLFLEYDPMLGAIYEHSVVQ